jgi:hypothetical protein
MPIPQRIIRLSNWLYWASAVLTYVLPLVVILSIARGWSDPENLLLQFPMLPETTQISALQGTLAAFFGVLSVYPLVATCLAMKSLFSRYKSGEILTEACANDINRIGRSLVLVAAATVIVPTLQILVLSWNAPGGRILSIGLDGGTLGFLLAGGLLFAIGFVMVEAARTAAENAEFV